MVEVQRRRRPGSLFEIVDEWHVVVT